MRIRNARIPDAADVLALVNRYAEKQLVLPVSRDFLFEHINQYSIARDRDRVAGAVLLRIYSPVLAEIRSLVVAERHRKHGLGRRLVRAALRRAKKLGIEKVFALTRLPDFFRKLGFAEVNKDNFPDKIWRDCESCPKKDACDEVTVAIEVGA